ncbi:DUF5996 family protein [Pendulispora albinea]|uniref:DUF5996 family protein n=1 Tax=Pendulispora albinea TaxID=2741071 RepID=A0ABZ2M1Q7_9BACT
MAAMNPYFERQRPFTPIGRRALPRGGAAWPALPLERWRDTYRTLHLYAQIVGKIRLALTPKTNQWWNVPFYLGPRGFRTSPMTYPSGSVAGCRTFEIAFDFVRHELEVSDSDGRVRTLAFVPALSVAEFHRELHRILAGLGIEVRIRPRPCELPVRTPFAHDTSHRTYVASDAEAFFHVLRRVYPVFETFRAGFRGKCSPVHFFWGQFDLAVTRYNGWRMPTPPGSEALRDRHDEEHISLGFWPGDAWSDLRDERSTLGAMFYSSTVPEPAGIAKHAVEPEGAYYLEERKQFVLPYEHVRSAPDPAQAILSFAQSTYEAGAALAGWNPEALAYP